MSSTDCCICMDAINSSINNCTTPCGHSFCFQCLAKALEQNNTCPCCRAVLMEVPDDDDDDDSIEWTTISYGEDEEDTELFSDEALSSFRLFMVRTHNEYLLNNDCMHSSEGEENEREIYEEGADTDAIAEEANMDDEKAEEATVIEEDDDSDEETAVEDDEPLAEVEAITAKLQSRGITMVDLVAMLTDRKSTKIAKHTDRFINALDRILNNAIEDCDREAKELAQPANV